MEQFENPIQRKTRNEVICVLEVQANTTHNITSYLEVGVAVFNVELHDWMEPEHVVYKVVAIKMKD